MEVVSLFSGAGGLDYGFIKAGFNIVWANDISKDAVGTYKQNIGNHIHLGDISEFMEELKELSGDIDLLIGGPPCQGFSVAGKMDPHDPRSKLVWSYIEVLEMLKPRAFVMENVKALGSLTKWNPLKVELLKKMRSLGYSTNYAIVNSSDFNVPQARERVIFIGFRSDSFIIPDIEKMLEPYKVIAKPLREALGVLDRAGTGNNTSLCNAKITLTPNPVLRKSPYAGMLFNGLGRPVKLDGYCATLPASMGGNKTPIIDEDELYNKSTGWVEIYHQKLLSGERASDFQIAPSRLRRLTVEEAAIIQTFPLNYSFCGSQSSKYTQIGNAVPCELAYNMARMIYDYLNINTNLKIISIPQQLLYKEAI